MHRGRSDGRTQGRARGPGGDRSASSAVAIARPVVSSATARVATAIRTATVTRTPNVRQSHAQLPNRATMTTGDRNLARTITVAPSNRLARTARLRAETPATNRAVPPAIAANDQGVAVAGVVVVVTGTTRTKRVPTIRHLRLDPQRNGMDHPAAAEGMPRLPETSPGQTAGESAATG